MKKPNNEQEFLKIQSYQIDRAKVSKDGLVRFNLTLNGVAINGCRVAEGKNGDFIAFPSYKGSDGKYYQHVFVRLSQEDQDKILKEVEDMIN